MNYALFFDIDGTIATYNQPISSKLRERILQIKNMGHAIFLSTGRSYSDIPEDILSIGFDGYICSIGAYIRTKDQVIRHIPFPETYIHEIHNLLNKSHISAYFESENRIYQAPQAYSLKHEFPLYKNISDFGHFYTIAYHMLPGQSLNLLLPYLNQIQARIIPQTDTHGDIVMPGCDKGIGMQYLLRHLHMEHYKTIAFGDSLNDLEMFAAAGYAVAMGHGPAALKQQADMVTASFNEDGVLLALNTLFSV